LELGTLISGGSTGISKSLSYDISEIPRFVLAGSIIPGISVTPGDMLGLAQRPYVEPVISVYPGLKGMSATSIYEDDGRSVNYLNGKFTWTNISTSTNANSIVFSIAKTPKQPFDEFPVVRSYYLHFIAVRAPSSITVNGMPVQFDSSGGGQQNSWRYDGSDLAVVVRTDSLKTAADLVVIANFTAGNVPIGYQGMLSRAKKAKSQLDLTNGTPGTHVVSPAYLNHLSSVAKSLEWLVGRDLNAFNSLLDSVPTLYTKAVAEVKSIEPSVKGSPAWLQWNLALHLLLTATA